MSLITQGYGYSRNVLTLGLGPSVSSFYADVETPEPLRILRILEKFSIFVPTWAVAKNEYIVTPEFPKIIIPTLYFNFRNTITTIEGISAADFIDYYVEFSELIENTNNLSVSLDIEKSMTSINYRESYILESLVSLPLPLLINTPDTMDFKKRIKYMNEIYSLVGI
jgi:hypothetical protein